MKGAGLLRRLPSNRRFVVFSQDSVRPRTALGAENEAWKENPGRLISEKEGWRGDFLPISPEAINVLNRKSLAANEFPSDTLFLPLPIPI